MTRLAWWSSRWAQGPCVWAAVLVSRAQQRRPLPCAQVFYKRGEAAELHKYEAILGDQRCAPHSGCMSHCMSCAGAA